MDTTWIKNHKLVVGLFGAAVAGYVLYSFLHKGSASGTSSPVVGGGSPQYLVPIVQSPGIDTTGLSPQSVSQTGSTPNQPSTASTPSTNTPSPLTNAVQVGAGYFYGNPAAPVSTPVTSLSGNQFEWISNGSALANLETTNPGSVYWSPTPGVFDPINAAQGQAPPPGTPAFLKVS